MTRAALVGTIECFVLGDEFKLYVERLEHFFVLNKVNEDKEKIAILASFGGSELYKIANKLTAPAKIRDCTYTAIIEKLDAHFTPTRNTIAESFKFYKREQLHTESISEYIVELKAMAENCVFGDALDRALRDKFVCGIHDGQIQQRLLNEKLDTFEKACEIALTMETTKNDLQIMNTGAANHIGQRRQKFERRQNGSSDNSSGNNNNTRNEAETKRRNQYSNNNNNTYNARSSGRGSQISNVSCWVCGKSGHISRYCNKREQRNGFNSIEDNDDIHNLDETDTNFGLQYLNKISNNIPLKQWIDINGIKIFMELDTGACGTVMHFEQFMTNFPDLTVRTSMKNFKLISGESISVLFELELTVIKSAHKFIPLMGRDWLDVLYDGWREFFKGNEQNNINRVENTKEYKQNIVSRFGRVFSHDCWQAINECTVDIILKPNTPNIFCKAYTVPFGLREIVEKEIDRLVKNNILVPIKQSNFASPIVVVKKPDGSIRICVDCKRSINKYVETDHYPLPIIEDILADLSDCNVFCTLDLTGAYQQLRASEKSKEYLTINTHKGLFRFTRLVFGVKSAPAIFQAKMDEILRGIDKVKCYFDDVCIGGKDLSECREKLD